MENKGRKIFCYAPWVHSHFSMTGKRALCCVATPFSSQFSSRASYWNCEELKSVRLKMLAGKPSEDHCQICMNNSNGSYSPREMFDEYASLEDSFIKSTQEDGFFSQPARFYDFRLENTCNLSCRMCDPHASSKIEGYWKEALDSKSPRLNSLLLKESSDQEVAIPEIHAAVESHEVKELYWASGEAFFQKTHWQVIDSLIESAQEKSTTLKYHTNLNYPMAALKRNIERLKSFKKVVLIISIDGVEDTGEFIRDGLKWNLFVKTLEEIRKVGNIEVESFNVTLTIPGLLNLKGLIDFLQWQNEQVNISLCALGDQSTLLSPLALDPEILKELLVPAASHLNSLPSSTISSSFLTVFQHARDEVKRGSSKPADDIILALLEESLLLDRAADRQAILAFYLSQPVLRKWVKGVFDRSLSHVEGIDFVLKHDALGFKRRTLFLALLMEEFYNRQLIISYVGSFPSSLSRTFDEFLGQDRYSPYFLIQNDPRFKELEIERVSYLGLLFRPLGSWKWLNRFMDLFLPSFFVHFRARVMVKLSE